MGRVFVLKTWQERNRDEHPSWLKSMPKSGGWMNVIKVTLGFLELAFALKFLSVADLAYGWRILDRETFLALWSCYLAALLGLSTCWARSSFPHDDDDIGNLNPFLMALFSLAFAVYRSVCGGLR